MLMESLLICSKDYKPKKWVFVFFAAVYFAAAGWMNHDDLLAEDIVFLKRSAIQSGRTRFQGTIREFDSENLYLVTSDGRKQTINTQRIARVETADLSGRSSADRLFKSFKFEQANQAYQKAIAGEQRQWVKRELIAQQILCQSALEENEKAIGLFLALSAGKPNHRFFHVIPVTWQFRPIIDSQKKVFDKMLSGNPLEQFIAASWSLDQHSNTVAIKVLRQLAGRDDPDGMMTRVSQLAAFQVYRCEISSLSNKDLLRWRRAIEKMHRLDRAGPIWMAGNLMQNNENYLSAAAEFLKLPILYPEHYQLGAASLEAAAIALDRQGDRSAGNLVLRELANRYTTTVPGRRAMEKFPAGGSTDLEIR